MAHRYHRRRCRLFYVSHFYYVRFICYLFIIHPSNSLVTISRFFCYFRSDLIFFSFFLPRFTEQPATTAKR